MRTIPRCVALLIIVIAALPSQQAFAATAREPEEILPEPKAKAARRFSTATSAATI